MLHIVAIGWLWVAFMVAITENNVVAGVMTFLVYGSVPAGMLIYLIIGSGRRVAEHQRAQREAANEADGERQEAARADEGKADEPGSAPPST